jgi:hypothetical protein
VSNKSPVKVGVDYRYTTAAGQVMLRPQLLLLLLLTFSKASATIIATPGWK